MTRQSARYANIDYATIQAGVARGRIERSRAIWDAFRALARMVKSLRREPSVSRIVTPQQRGCAA